MSQLADSSVFLTGGTGFIGSHLRDRLAELGSDVTLFVRPNSAVEQKPNESVLHGDVTDPESIIVDNQDIVIHLAAQTSVETAIESPRTTWDVNATGTLNILEAVRYADVDQVAVASTASVYGPPRQLPITEDQSFNPIEPYGASKLAGDQLAQIYNSTYGTLTSVGRFFNVYGPRQPKHNVIPAIIEQALHEDTIKLGNLTPTRDFIYIDDAVDGLLTILTQGSPGEVYNIASGHEVQIGELAEQVIDLIDASPTIVSTSDRQRDEGVEIPRHVADTTRLQSLGWSPRFELRDGLNETIQEYSR